jgi:hypothetical protein
MAFHKNTIKLERLFHILRFIHFRDNKNEPDKTDENYDRLWKMKTAFYKLSNVYAKYHSKTEHINQ